ncbi:MAG: helix-hairpin-helix domain-containing protein, partial [Promethearchaeota archaeon]|jgi:DNA repair protein RadA
MRTEYVGIGKLAVRQGVLNSMIHGLSRIAETYNCAVLLTNQVATKMMGMFSANDAIGGNIVAHGCHFRVMFKTKGFSSNSSLKRRAVIVDAPDLPPNECEFFITAAGVADTEKIEIPDEKGLDFEVETLYEESEEHESEEATDITLTNVKGIGKGTAESLETEGITTVEELLDADPENLSSKISGISPKKVSEWQNNAKALLKT